MNAPDMDRSRFLGGSDAAAILALSPFDTPLDLYLFKLGEKVKVFTPQQQRSLKRGKREEPRIVDDLIDEYGIKVTKRSSDKAPNRYADPLEPYLAAEIDFEWEVRAIDAERFGLDFGDATDLIGSIQNGEVKTVHHFAAAKFGDMGTDEVPIEYYVQAQHGLMVSNRQLCLFAVRNGFDLTVYFVKRDDEMIAGLREKEIAFWHENVLARVPPEPKNLPDIFELFKRRFASRVDATPEIAEKVQLLAAARAAEAAAKAQADDLKFDIGVFMLGEGAIVRDEKGKLEPVAVPQGIHELHVGGVPLLNVVIQNQRRIDADQLREKHPEVAAECTKVSESLVFKKPAKRKK